MRPAPGTRTRSRWRVSWSLSAGTRAGSVVPSFQALALTVVPTTRARTHHFSAAGMLTPRLYVDPIWVRTPPTWSWIDSSAFETSVV